MNVLKFSLIFFPLIPQLSFAAIAEDQLIRQVHLQFEDQTNISQAQFDLLKEKDRLDILFQNGLRHKPQVLFGPDQEKYQAEIDQTSNKEKLRFPIKRQEGLFQYFFSALIPSAEIISIKPEYGSNAGVLNIIPREVDLGIYVNEIDMKGASTGRSLPLRSFAGNPARVETKFTSSILLRLSNIKPIPSFISPSDPLYFPFGATINLYAVAQSLTTDSLPSNIITRIKSYITVDIATKYDFQDEDLTDSVIETKLIPGNKALDHAVFYTHIHPLEEGAQEALKFPTTSEFTYQISNPYYPETIKTITLPGGNLGTKIGTDGQGSEYIFEGPIDSDNSNQIGAHSGEVSTLVIGADIEGLAQSNTQKFIYQSDNALAGVSPNLQKEGGVHNFSEEDFIKGKNDIIAFLEPEPTNELSQADLNDNPEKNIFYFQGDDSPEAKVIIKEDLWIDRPLTIIAERANIVINGDISYRNQEASLGIMATTDQLIGYPQTGNVFVASNIQKIQAMIYADGTLMSFPYGNENIVTVDLINAQRPSTWDLSNTSEYQKQLIFIGHIFTKNTLGGSILDARGHFSTPWEDALENTEANRRKAQKYDYHMIRRYSPTFDTTGNYEQDPQIDVHCLPQIDIPARCDANRHAFVIRQSIVSQLPPGFSSLSSLSFY